ncbi:MAG: hypothetical protein H7A51_04830 [Akkermansiaceae bacterium]|nr:hypothetical protein [Akkermansiaceae bacterium]
MQDSSGTTDTTAPRTDPYAPPASHPTDGGGPASESPRNIVVAWERMRIQYNLILLLPGLVVLILYVAGNSMPMAVAIPGALVTALAANVCYFAGSISEFFVCALLNTPEHPSYRKTAYIAGIVLSLVVFGIVSLPGAMMAF